jgi:hypothetical protein
VNYSDLIPLLVEAIHELEHKISELQQLKDCTSLTTATIQELDNNPSCAAQLEIVLALKNRVRLIEEENRKLKLQLNALK